MRHTMTWMMSCLRYLCTWASLKNNDAVDTVSSQSFGAVPRGVTHLLVSHISRRELGWFMANSRRAGAIRADYYGIWKEERIENEVIKVLGFTAFKRRPWECFNKSSEGLWEGIKTLFESSSQPLFHHVVFHLFQGKSFDPYLCVGFDYL